MQSDVFADSRTTKLNELLVSWAVIFMQYPSYWLKADHTEGTAVRSSLVARNSVCGRATALGAGSK